MASTMQLDFSQAMSDFKIMFPDMDRDVIEAVLRANQGAVDATIDQLLAMSTDNQNEKLRNELDKPGAPVVSGKETTTTGAGILVDIGVPDVKPLDTTEPKTLLSPSPVSLSLGASPKMKKPIGVTQFVITPTPTTVTIPGLTQQQRKESKLRWNPPMLRPLPPGFLRIPPSTDVVRSEYDLPDEQFALMLQNEEFMNELRWNQEFMNALEKDHQGVPKAEDDAAFKERIKHMGKISRKKFLQMARVFTWQRNKKSTSAKQIDSLPLKEDPSDDEDHHPHHHVKK